MCDILYCFQDWVMKDLQILFTSVNMASFPKDFEMAGGARGKLAL